MNIRRRAGRPMTSRDEIPPLFFEAIGRNVFAASQLEQVLTEVAILLQITSGSPIGARNRAQEVRRKHTGQPGGALIDTIRKYVAAHPNSHEVQELQDLLDL